MSADEIKALRDDIREVFGRLRKVENRLAFGAGIIVAVQVLGMIALGAWL